MAPSKKSSPAPAPAPAEVVPETVEQTPPAVSVTSSTAEDAAADVSLKIAELTTKLSVILTQIKDVSAALRSTQKDVAKLQKQRDSALAAAAAGGSKRKRGGSAKNDAGSSTPRKPSGFAKPTGLSPELCAFLGVAADTKLARTDVTRLITKYIKDNTLYGTDDKRAIIPDAKLQAVLTVPEGQKLTYFNLQAFIKHHFIKEPAVAASD